MSRSPRFERIWQLLQAIEARLPMLTETQRHKVADEILQALAQVTERSDIYTPSQGAVKQYVRARRVIAEFTGTNHAELATKHGIALRTVYHIIKQHRERQKRQQHDPQKPQTQKHRHTHSTPATQHR